MSRQAQYAALAEVTDPGGYARLLLRLLLQERPNVAKRFDELKRGVTVRHLDGYGMVTAGLAHDEDERLAICLQWIIDSKLARIPVEISNHLAGGAARVFDYPLMMTHAISEEMGRRSRGKSRKGENLSKSERDNAIARALRRRQTDDRSIAVGDLAADIGTSQSNASKVLASAGWPGRKGRPKAH